MPNQAIKDFSLQGTGGPFKLSALKNKYLIVYFFPVCFAQIRIYYFLTHSIINNHFFCQFECLLEIINRTGCH